MKVGIVNDASPHSGVGKYGYQLAEFLSKSKGVEADLIQKSYLNQPKYSADEYIEGVELPLLNTTTNDIFELFSFDRDGYDVIHFNTLKGVNPRPGDFVTIHDVMPITCPDNYSWFHRLQFKRNLRKIKDCNVICVSEKTKQELLNVIDFDLRNVYVVPNGVDTNTYKNQDIVKSKKNLGLDIQKKYLLHVGSNEERKNLEFLAKLMGIMPKNYKLIRIGPESDHLPKSREDVIYLKDLTEGEMVSAYNSAEYTLLPSTYEGFGRPIIESLACKTQVIKSRKNIPEFESAIELKLNIEKWKEVITAARSKQIDIDYYSWDRVAERVELIFRECLNNK